MTSLPPQPNSWREAGVASLPYQDEITPQRCWINPSSSTDKDMCAASSLNSHGRESTSSSLDDQRKVAQLDISLTGDNRASAIRFSGYAPFTSSPAREPLYGGPTLHQSSSGLLPSLTSSPTSSITSYPDRPSSASLRQQSSLYSYGSLNVNRVPSTAAGVGAGAEGFGNGFSSRPNTTQSQLQWYQQQQQQTNGENSDEMIVGSYRDSRPHPRNS
jgi:hypothetical protein